MDNFTHIERIASLLAKRRMDSLSEDEQFELAQWQDQSPENRAMAEKWLMDGDLSADFYEFANTHTAAPLHNMQRKVTMRSGRNRRIYMGASVAAILLLFIGIRYVPNMLHQSPVDTISVIAAADPVLYFDDGGQMALKGTAITVKEGAITVTNEEGEVELLTENKEIQYATIHIPKGYMYEVILEDGTHIWLNADSKLRYPLSFTGTKREVTLWGEAYFKVTHDALHPFRIEAGRHHVEVLGTEFNIYAYEDDLTVRTTLVAGSIAVETENDRLLLHPGEQILLSNEGALVCKVNISNIASWRENMFVMEGRTLDEIMTSLARWYDFKVEYVDAEIRNTVFNGIVPRYEEFGRILNLLERTDEVRFTVKGNTVTVKQK